MKHTLIIIMTVFFYGCATTGQNFVASNNRLNTFKAAGKLKENEGILLLSAGRDRDPCKECNANFFGILPFVSYSIFAKNEAGEPEEIAFLPAEAGMFNELDKEQYGFVHIRELPAGEYIMIGSNNRGSSVMIPVGSYFMPFSTGSEKTGIAFKFSVTPGVVNYLGEFITVNGNLVTSSIKLNRKIDRDINYLYKKYPKLSDHEIIDIVPEKL